MTADYGQAIRVMHHGCEESLRMLDSYAGAGEDPGKQVLLGVAVGYAYALEVMTGRPASEHLRANLRRIIPKKNLTDPAVLQRVENLVHGLPRPPHVDYETRVKEQRS